MDLATTTTSTTTPTNTTTKVPSMKTKKVAKKVAKAPTKAPAHNGNVLKSICKDLKVEPRIARRRLRAAKLAFHGTRERWEFTPTQIEKVRSIIKGE